MPSIRLFSLLLFAERRAIGDRDERHRARRWRLFGDIVASNLLPGS